MYSVSTHAIKWIDHKHLNRATKRWTQTGKASLLCFTFMWLIEAETGRTVRSLTHTIRNFCLLTNTCMIVGRHSLPLQTCAIVASHDICAVVTTAAVVLRTLVNICEIKTFDSRVVIFIHWSVYQLINPRSFSVSHNWTCPWRHNMAELRPLFFFPSIEGATFVW